MVDALLRSTKMKIPTSYIIATALTAFLFTGMISSKPGIVVPLLCLVLAPLVIKNSKWKQRVYFASLSVFMLIAAFEFYSFIRVLLSINSLSDFEDSDGEGSPIGPLVGMFMETISFVIPWTVASIRGFSLYTSMKMAEQGTEGMTPEYPQPPH